MKVVNSTRGKEGSIAQITKASQGLKSKNPSGEIVSVDFEGTSLDEGKVYGFTADQVVKATDAEIAKATAPKLKVGDFVKITSGTPSIIEGEIYEVLIDEENEMHIIDNDGDSRGFPLALGRVKYEIVDAETAKWAKIGRKVNEFKKGDSVFVMHPDGGKIYGIIHEDSCGHKIKVDFGKQYRVCTEDKSDLTLVAPVESTFA